MINKLQWPYSQLVQDAKVGLVDVPSKQRWDSAHQPQEELLVQLLQSLYAQRGPNMLIKQKTPGKPSPQSPLITGDVVFEGKDV